MQRYLNISICAEGHRGRPGWAGANHAAGRRQKRSAAAARRASRRLPCCRM